MKSITSFPRIPALVLGFSMIWTACSDPAGEAITLSREAEAVFMASQSLEGEERIAKLDEAIALFEKASTLDPALLEPKLALADLHWRKGDQLGAVRRAESLIADFPDDFRVWVFWGDMQYRIFKWKPAIEAFKKAIDLGCDESIVVLKLGGAYGKDGDFESAFEAYDRAAELGAPKATVLYNLGLCYEGTRNPEMALEHYLKALEADPTHLAVLKELTRFYMERATKDSPELMKAKGYAEKAYELDRSDIKVMSNLADIYNILEDHESALKIVDEALKANPEDPQLIKYRSGLEQLIESKKQEEGE